MPMRERTVRPNGSHAAKYAANIDALAWLGLSCTAMQSGRVVRVGILALVAAASSYGDRPRCRSQNFDLPFLYARITYELNILVVVASTPYTSLFSVYGCSLMSN